MSTGANQEFGPDCRPRQTTFFRVEPRKRPSEPRGKISLLYVLGLSLLVVIFPADEEPAEDV